jgi:hypothetical protein
MTTDRKKLLLYLLVVLAIARFVAVPASGKLDERKALYEDTLNANRSKMQLVARQSEAAAEDTPENIGRVMGQIYPESYDKTSAETDISDWLTKSCESKGMGIINFQYLEETKHPGYIEVPVIMRMTGQIKKIFELLREAKERKPMVMVKKFELREEREDYNLTLTVAGYVRTPIKADGRIADDAGGRTSTDAGGRASLQPPPGPRGSSW